ncbi:MAG: hypothetical protein KJO01_06790 [Gammaproteobacteria bacterium]|nr:hypothetical protein [Gammaproteobacteria bacterium]MBT8110350.1 hypothetical protein [Gammaproteobacteria bacterium]NND46193.1 hypothetical protein [Woeseiaceae bacterium]NNL45053.1 hypothetical protein [Woeseiaceae bacterium]
MKKYAWIAVFVTLVLPLGALADQHEAAEEPAPLSDVWMIAVKGGMDAKFTEAVKKHMAFRAKAGESRTWMAYRQVIGDKLNAVAYRACCFDYADQDAYIVEDGKLGLADDWNKNVDQYVDHYHHYLEETDWENSHWPEGSDGPYFGVTTWTWKEGAGPGPGEVRKQFSQIAKKEGWGDAGDGHNWLWFERMGGKPVLTLVSSYESFADMAPDEQSFFDFLAENLGSPEAASEMFTKFGAGFTSSDYAVWVYDAELSTPSKE